VIGLTILYAIIQYFVHRSANFFLETAKTKEISYLKSAIFQCVALLEPVTSSYPFEKDPFLPFPLEQ
jgi:hypothetical protein